MNIKYTANTKHGNKAIEGYYVKRHYVNSQSHQEYEHHILTGEFVRYNSESYEIDIDTLRLVIDGIIIQMDGNKTCATYSDFENLQESDAGFGDKTEDALISLLK